MLYGTFVSRISELSRTLVQSGGQGEFKENGSVFRVGTDILVPVRSGFRLKILQGDARGSYAVVGALHANELEVEHVFQMSGGPVPWEIYDEGVSEEGVRRVLHVFPDVVMECEEDEQVKTPLGVFRLVRRKRKLVRTPTGEWTHAPERIQARIRPGKRLQRSGDDPANEPLAPTSAASDPGSAPDEGPGS